MTQKNKQSAPPPSTPKLAASCAAPIDDHLDPDLFKALGEPTRVRLLACLAKCGRPCSVSELAECCSVDLSVVSRHLAVLARAGALVARRDGKAVLYEVPYAALAARLRGLAEALRPPRRRGVPTECCDGSC